MLKLIDIVKEYKVEEESVLALKNVSIEFRKNEFVSILGPSGCGKTTMLNIIGGLDRYTSGDIQIEGISTKQYDDVDWDTYRNRRVGFVFQSYNLIPHMNILKNVALSLTIAGVGRDERVRRALEALRKVGLESQARKKPNQLSGGQMQRVAIARALVNNPEIILADEPTGALDSESGIQIMDLLKEVAQDRLVIMVTHNPLLADEYSTRIVYLRDGEIVGDTMPYDSEKEANEAAENADGEALELDDEVVTSAEETSVSVAEAEQNENSAAQQISEEGASQLDESVAVAEEGEDIVTEQSVEQGEDIAAGQSAEQGEGGNVEGGEVKIAADATDGKRKKKKPSRFIEKLRKIRRADKSAMKLSTAISLSWTNLISKKGRTLLTSIAGSIGIIGIILVLALSTGAKVYINNLEESALSNYPITVNKSNMDITQIMSKLMDSMTQNSDDKVDDDVIKVQEVLGNVIPTFFHNMQSANNDLHAFKAYIDDNFDRNLADVRYQYGTTFNCYAPDNGTSDEAKNRYMKINPYTETMNLVFAQVLEQFPALKDIEIPLMGQTFKISDALGYMGTMLGNAWSEMSDNQKLLQNQYELVGKQSRWPVRENEIVVVVDQNNRLYDFQLFMLGLQSQDEVMTALTQGDKFSEQTYDLEEVLSLEYKILSNVNYLEEVEGQPGTWKMHKRTEQSKDFVDSHAVKFSDGSDTLKVTGVVRPKPGAVASSITGIIGYRSELTTYLLQQAQNHPAVIKINELYQAAMTKGQYESPIEYRADPDGAPMTSATAADGQIDFEIGDMIKFDRKGEDHDTQHFTLLRQLGFADVEYPQAIEFYCTSFETKRDVEAFIAKYNDEEGKNISYSDSLSSMMRFIDTMASTITGVLVAFAAISLIVSTIMIAIIIYTSVLERRKEIGVLRSIGARKKDISRVFLAESAILGGYSGIIGIFVSFLISLAGSAILFAVFGIQGLMQVTWWHCVLMLGISVLLSMLAGFIPSRIAAKKDPAIALRSE